MGTAAIPSLADSTTTLVASCTLVLDPDNPSNTTIRDATSGALAYSVDTDIPRGGRPLTTVRGPTGAVLARCEWRDTMSDRITLGEDGTPMAMNSWMRKSLVPFKETVYFEEQGVKYKWKGNAAGRALQLFREDDKTSAILSFSKSRIDRRTSPPTYSAATLELDTRVAPIRDTAVLAFLFLEKTRRVSEAESQSRGDVLGQPMLSGSYRNANGGV